MVETVSASPLPQATGNGAVSQGLEPGTELKARVEANLPGGVVRLATADAKLELRVPAPLPEGGEVTVTVSGTKQQPAILITVGKDQAQTQQPATPAPSSQNPASQPQTPQGSQGQIPQAQGPQGQAPASQAGQIPLQSEPAPQLQPQPSTAAAFPKPAPVLAHLIQVLSVNTSPGLASGHVQPLPQAPLPAAPAPSAAPQGTQSAQPAAPGNAAQVQPLSPAATSEQVSGNAALPAGSAAQGSTAPPAATGQPQPSAPVPNSATSGAGQPPAGVAPPATAPTSGQPLTAQPASSAGTATGVFQPGAGVPAPGSLGQPGNGVSGQQTSQTGSQPAASTSAGATGLPAQSAQGTSIPLASPASAPAQALSASLEASAAGASTPPASQPNPASAPPPASVAAAGNPPPPAGGGSGLQASVAGPVSGSIAANAGTRTPVAGAPPGSVPPSGLAGSTPGSQPLPVVSAANAGPASAPAANLTGPGAPNQGDAQINSPFLSTGGQAAALTRTAISQPYPASTGVSVSQTAVSAGQGQPAGLQPASQQAASQVADILRQPLSEQQAGLGNLFAQIGSLMSAQSSGTVSLPDPVVKAMQQILGLRLPSAQAPTGQDLQQAVRLSGQFREAQLALPTGAPATGQAALPDLKSALLSFKALLQQLGARSEISRPAGQPPAPSRHGAPHGQAQQTSSGFWAGAAPQNLQALLKETDSALARLRLTQLSNTKLSRDDAPRVGSRPMDLVVELPLAFGHETAVLQMQVGRDGAGNKDEDEGEPAWRLRFALDLTATGPLEAAISLRGGGTYASLWVDRKETFDSLNAVRETMEAAFADAGLDLQELRLIRGLPPKTAARYGALIDRQS